MCIHVIYGREEKKKQHHFDRMPFHPFERVYVNMCEICRAMWPAELNARTKIVVDNVCIRKYKQVLDVYKCFLS